MEYREWLLENSSNIIPIEKVVYYASVFSQGRIYVPGSMVWQKVSL